MSRSSIVVVLSNYITFLGATALVLSLPSLEPSRTDTSAVQAERRLITFGKVAKIDKQTQSFELKSQIVKTTRSENASGMISRLKGEFHLGVGANSRREGREIHGPFDPLRMSEPEAHRPRSLVRYMTSRLQITADTAITQDGRPIGFATVRNGDGVTVYGICYSKTTAAALPD